MHCLSSALHCLCNSLQIKSRVEDNAVYCGPGSYCDQNVIVLIIVMGSDPGDGVAARSLYLLNNNEDKTVLSAPVLTLQVINCNNSTANDSKTERIKFTIIGRCIADS
jgi:hypothetical protein